MTLTLKNDIREVSRLGDFLKAAAERYHLEDAQGKELRLAVEEAVVNVIDYAYPEGEEGEITLELNFEEGGVLIRVIDSGIPFDPTKTEEPDTSLPARERHIGGLGIYLLRSLTDSIRYERREGKNILILVKRFIHSLA